MWSPPMWTVLGGIARLDVEFPRSLCDLFEDELRVEEDDLALGLLPGGGEELDRLRLGELDADLRDDSAPASVEHARSPPRRGSRSGASG